MERPHASNDVRERALAAIDAGKAIVDVAAFFGNDPSTIRRWVRKRNRAGSVQVRPRSGRPRKMHPSDHVRLRDQVAAHPDAILADHCPLWQDAGGASVSISTMRRALRAAGITLTKRPSSPWSRMRTPARPGRPR